MHPISGMGVKVSSFNSDFLVMQSDRKYHCLMFTTQRDNLWLHIHTNSIQYKAVIWHIPAADDGVTSESVVDEP